MIPAGWDVAAIRCHFVFVPTGRIATNNAASTQVPRELLELLVALAPEYDNVHRGASSASQRMTDRFEAAYDDIAAFVGARSRRNVVVTRNATEAHNAVMYMLLADFRDGDNIVATTLEHNSNFVPWHALAREILPRLGRRVQVRLARFDAHTGALDLDHLASLVDERTKLIACTGASNFLGTKTPLAAVRAIAAASGYAQPDGERRSYLMVDGAQLVAGSAVDFRALGADFLSVSFHKMLAPFGAGALIADEQRLATLPPFLYGGDMIAPGQVRPDHVAYHELPWRYAAGTPNILGTIAAAQALRLLTDLASPSSRAPLFDSAAPIAHDTAAAAMGRLAAWCRALTARALDRLATIPGITIYGARDATLRASLVAFNVAGHDPMRLAAQLNEAGIESRAGCHCATLAHHALGIEASCRFSFYLYNSFDDVDRAVDALAHIVDAGIPTSDGRGHLVDAGIGQPDGHERQLADASPSLQSNRIELASGH